MEEIWKSIINYENLYEVSNWGRIKSFLRRGSQINVKTINCVRKLLREGIKQSVIEKTTGLSESTIYRIKHNKVDYNEKILKTTLGKHGYLSVTFRKNGEKIPYLIHRLVLETFIGPCPPGMECRHLDGNPRNNRLENLCWGTRSENQQDSVGHGTHYSYFQQVKNFNIGEDNPAAKLTRKEAGQIRSLKGIFSQSQRANMFNVSSGAVQSIDDGKTWKDTNVQ